MYRVAAAVVLVLAVTGARAMSVSWTPVKLTSPSEAAMSILDSTENEKYRRDNSNKAVMSLLDSKKTFSPSEAAMSILDSKKTYSANEDAMSIVNSTENEKYRRDNSNEAVMSPLDSKQTYSANEDAMSRVNLTEKYHGSNKAAMSLLDSKKMYSANKDATAIVDSKQTYSANDGTMTIVDLTEKYHSSNKAAMSLLDSKETYSPNEGTMSLLDSKKTYSPNEGTMSLLDSKETFSPNEAAMSILDSKKTYSPNEGTMSLLDSKETFSPNEAAMSILDSNQTYSASDGAMTIVDSTEKAYRGHGSNEVARTLSNSIAGDEMHNGKEVHREDDSDASGVGSYERTGGEGVSGGGGGGGGEGRSLDDNIRQVETHTGGEGVGGGGGGGGGEGRSLDDNNNNIRQVEILEEKDSNNGDVQTFSVKFDNGTVWRFRRMRRKKAPAHPPLPSPLRVHAAPAPQRRPHAQGVDEGVFDAGKAHIKNKLAKFLNLFTVIQFSNDACATADGLKGTCYHHLECRSQGGLPSGPCAQGYGSCCIFQSSCGDVTAQNCTYFVDPGVTSNVKECSLDVVKSHPDVTQLRLDFAQFELVGPQNGSCYEDQFIVSGQNRNSIVPTICGINTGQHIYIDVTTTVSPVRLSVITQMRNLDRHYRIKVTQVLKGSPLEAPRNCLQYYRGPTGTIESFNYQSQLANKIVTPAGYMNNLNYAICIRKEDGYCSITFKNTEPFQLTNVDENGVSLISPRQAGVEIFDCPDDYIVLNGLRMCGERLNDASGDVDYTKDAPVTETTNGPFVIPVRTNAAYNGRGFRVGFAQSPCT